MTTGAGHLNAYAIGILVDLRRLEKLRQKILSVRTAVSQFNQSFRGKGIGTSIKNIEALTVSLQKLGTVAKTASAGVVSSQAKVTSALKLSGETTGKYAHAFTQYNRNVLGMSRGTKNAFTDMFRRVALWSAGVGLLFGVISKVRTIFKGMQDLEESMTELKKVMDDSTPWARAQSSIINTAKTFSIAATEVSKIAQVWAQQGKTLSEVTELTKTAALGMNSANLTATQSVEFLTSATKAYNIEASQTERIIDGIMKVQSDFAITSENLAKGFNVAGALAAKAQVDMGGLFGMMTAIGEVTRETGNTIGNSLKTQFARLQNPATIAYLQQFGIQMKEIEAGTNRIRRLSPSQIFKQIADLSRTGQIDTDAVIDIALKIGGIRKFKDALILIERFGVAEEARAKFLLAYNDAQRANDLVQENLTRKTEKLNTAFLDLGVALSDQGLYTGLKNIIDFSTKIVEGATRAARTPTGERLLKLGGIAILAKAVTSLSKVILAGTVRGTLKGAAVAATGTGGVTTAQQAQLQAYTESQRRSQLELEKLAISSKRTRAGLMEVARSSNTTLSVAIKKLSIEAAGAGREFNAARFTFKKFWADMKIGAKTFWLGATASIQKGSGIPTAGKAAGLGAVGIGSRVTGILKGGLQVAAWMAAMEAVFFLWDKFFGEQEQTKSILRKTIDTESQATQAVLELSSAYEENRVAAKDAGRAVKSYVESLTFIDRFDQATVAAKKLAAAVRAGTITTQQELKKFLEDKVKLKDIKTLEEAQEIAIKYRNFLKYELAGGLQEGLTILNKTTSEALSDFNDIILSAGAKGVTFGKAFNPRGPAPFTIESVGGETEGALVTIWKDAVKSMGKDWSKFVVDVTKEGGLPTSTSDTTVDFSKATLALIKELNTHGRTIRLGDRTQAQGFSEFTQSQIYFADSLIKFAGLAKETIGSRAGVEGADTEAPTPQELVRQDLVRASRAAALKLQEQLKLPEGLLDDIIQLETIFPRAVGDWVDALYGGLYAMVKAEDLIWKATNKFVTDQEKIQIKELVCLMI